jgi:hypothetical protein
MDGINPSIMSSLFPEIGIDTKVSRNCVIEFYRDFKTSLADLMANLMDDSEELTIGGVTIPVGQRGGAAEQYAVNEWLSEQEFIFSQLLESYKFEQSLESKINNISFS